VSIFVWFSVGHQTTRGEDVEDQIFLLAVYFLFIADKEVAVIISPD
jgi:hypothetical protein